MLFIQDNNCDCDYNRVTIVPYIHAKYTLYTVQCTKCTVYSV